MIITTSLIIKALASGTALGSGYLGYQKAKEARLEAETNIEKVILGGIVGVVVFIFLTIIEKIFF